MRGFIHWNYYSISHFFELWIKKEGKHHHAELSPWWHFVFYWRKNAVSLVNAFVIGNYNFSPMKRYCFKDGVQIIWEYQDRMLLRLILETIKSTFAFIIPEQCVHLQGPSSIKKLPINY